MTEFVRPRLRGGANQPILSVIILLQPLPTTISFTLHMKFLFPLSLLALLCLSPVAQAQTAPIAATKPVAAGPSASSTAQFKTSAVCEMCKARIEKSLAHEKGVQSAVLDVPSKVLTVTYHPTKTSPAALRAAVQKTGYDADDQTAEAHAYNRLPDCCKKTSVAH